MKGKTMKSLNSDQVFYAFTPQLAPLLIVDQKEQFSLETRDCYGNQLHSDDDTMDGMDWSATNPATGPVYIMGVQPGDLLRIDIDKLELTGNSVMATIPGCGAIKGITEPETRVMDNSDRILKVKTEKGILDIPVKPMIGVIGVAPKEESISNGVPGMHGGNMDCNLIGEGTALYLHAAVDGALFGCGDIHAIMGDGEVVVCGAETPARVTFRASVVNANRLPTPFIENADVYAAIATAKTADEAYKKAVDNMFDFLTNIAGLCRGDAGRLMSLVGNLRFCQVVDPEITVRFEFPKVILNKLGFQGIGQ